MKWDCAKISRIKFFRPAGCLMKDLNMIGRFCGHPFQRNIFWCLNCTIGKTIRYDSTDGCILDRWDFFVFCIQLIGPSWNQYWQQWSPGWFHDIRESQVPDDGHIRKFYARKSQTQQKLGYVEAVRHHHPMGCSYMRPTQWHIGHQIFLGHRLGIACNFCRQHPIDRLVRRIPLMTWVYLYPCRNSDIHMTRVHSRNLQIERATCQTESSTRAPYSSNLLIVAEHGLYNQPFVLLEHVLGERYDCRQWVP